MSSKLFLYGSLLLLGAYSWDLIFPINKKLWTSSYVLLTVGLDCIILALMIYYLREKAAVMLSVVFLFLYWILCYLLGDSGDPLSLDGNAVLHVDRMLLSDTHLYHGEGVAFDPEGLLSTLPAIANVVGGYVAGRYIKQKGFTYEMLSKLFLYGSLLLLGAYSLLQLMSAVQVILS